LLKRAPIAGYAAIVYCLELQHRKESFRDINGAWQTRRAFDPEPFLS